MSEILINPLKSSEKYVYHYTKTETAFKYRKNSGRGIDKEIKGE